MLDVKIYGTTLYVGSVPLETYYGKATAHTFQNLIHKEYIIALTIGDLNASELYTRLHSSCVTSETLRSLDCDCVLQLEGALRFISEKGNGILFYLIQEGRGCGYIGKSRACMMVQYHDDKITTFDAYQKLGMKHDYRDYTNIREVAHMLGINKSQFTLLTNNPDKIRGFQETGLNLKKVEAIEVAPSPYNQSYLISKQKMGHLLCKTKTKVSRYKLPHKRIKPFNPYPIPYCSRFIHCASYYLPIKPVDNQIIFTPAELKKIKSKKIIPKEEILIHDNNYLAAFEEKDLTKIDVKPYWFKVNMYYDITSNNDYVILSYGDIAHKTPLIRIHSESLFNRFPLKEKMNLYKEKYKKSVQEIVKNGSGMILLLHRDGRGAGLGNYILNRTQKEEGTGTGLDYRDYDAVAQIFNHQLEIKKVKILYSGSSRIQLKRAFERQEIQIIDWIELEPKNQEKGHHILAQRIAEAPYYLLENNLKAMKFETDMEYIVTGIGSSEAHAKYLIYLTQKHHRHVKITYVPITGFIHTQKRENTKLIIISQGLSPSVKTALECWKYNDIILFTAVTKNNGHQEKREMVQQLEKSNRNKIFHFPVEDEYETLLRTIGPLAGYYFIHQVIVGKQSLQYEEKKLINTLKNSLDKLPPEEFFSSLAFHSRIVILASYPLASYFQNIVYKLEEGSFLSSVRLVDFLEFSHGPFQNIEYQYQQGVLTHFVAVNSGTEADRIVIDKTKSMLRNEYPIWDVSSELPDDLKIIEYEMIFNYFVLKLIERKNIDQINWFGKDRQGLLYNIQL